MQWRSWNPRVRAIASKRALAYSMLWQSSLPEFTLCSAGSVCLISEDVTLGPRVLTIGTAALGLAAMLVVSLVSAVRFTYDAPALHVFLETAGALIALLAAYLVFGRFRASSRLDDLMLSCGLAVLSASTLFFSSLPAASELDMGHFPTWAPLLGRLLGALFLTYAAFCPGTKLRHPRRSALVLFAAAGLLLTAIGVLIALVAERLPAGLDPTLAPPEALGRPHLYDHPVLVALQFLLAFLYAAAAVGFTRRAERTGDELLGWFAVGSALASLASFYTGDVIRLLSNLVLLAGAAREIGRYWRGLATIAVLEERRRIAWDLHDGLAQELAFILRRAKRAGEGDAIAVQVAGAAERALADARRAVAALTRPLDEPLDVALAQAVEEVADRFGQKLDLDLQPNVHVDPLIREDLVRIAREAVANAARHGRAPTVRVELCNRSRLRLTIADDGAGFQPHTANRHERFGLVSMQERAHALHADFHLTSTPGGGTQIQVTLP